MDDDALNALLEDIEKLTSETKPAGIRPEEQDLVDVELAAPARDMSGPDKAPESTAKKKRYKEVEAPKAEKKSHGFFWGMLLYTLLFLGLIAFFSRFLWQYMTSYEASRPEHYMEGMMDTLNDEDWYDALLANTSVGTTEFENSREVLKAYFDSSDLGDFTFAKKAGQYQDNAPVYSIRSHGKEVGILRLAPVGDAGYGFHYWKTDRFESTINSDALESVSIELLVPGDSAVMLNGKELSSRYIVEERVEYDDLNPYESSLPDRPYRVRYRVEGLYQDLKLEVEGYGELEPVDYRDGFYFYEIRETPQLNFQIRTYSNMQLEINGQSVPSSEAKMTEWTLFEELEEFVDPPQLCDYTLNGFYREPVIRVTDHFGAELTGEKEESGRLSYTYPVSEELKQEQEAFILEFLQRYINLATGDYNNRYSYYHAIKGYVLPDTELANYFFKSVSGGGDGGGMLSVKIHELSADHFIPINDICYICEARLDATEHRYNTDKHYATTYEIVAIKQDDTWYIAKMPPKDE